jgi:geranylgeranyl diphosphate synthase type II
MNTPDQQVTPAESFDEFARLVRHEVQACLEEAFSQQREGEVSRLAQYVACDDGHQWRAIATVASGLVFRADAMALLIPTACAMELAHSASLLLDDLPSMDNATVRRGKPCVHLMFPAWATDMGAAFLIMLAYKLVMENEAVAPAARVLAARQLSQAGLGMIAGQEMDLLERDQPGSAKRLVDCYRLKTGGLFAAAVELGAAQCGADAWQVERLASCGLNLGLSYQLLDDLLEAVGSGDQLGKRPGTTRDLTNVVRIMGVSEANRARERFQENALRLLDGFGPRAGLLRELVLRASCLRS